MVRDAAADPERLYVDSLRWRQQDLQGKLDAIGLQIASWTRDETDLKQQLRAVEQLLSAVGAPASEASPTIAVAHDAVDRSLLAEAVDVGANGAALDFSSWGPKSRAIYTTAAQVIKDAGVPLHYRVLAEEVQKKVALGGVDPGATLIAHLHRAQEFFPRVGRGVYALQGMATTPPPAATPTKAPAGRRRKTRRRTR
jgi:hypothetical protein